MLSTFVPTKRETPGVPTPGVHHYTTPLLVPVAMTALDLFCVIAV